MFYTHNINYENLNKETQNHQDFKREIDILRNEFYKKVKNIEKKNLRKNVGNIVAFSVTNEKNINDFVDEDDWKSINHTIYWKIKTFYNFHAGSKDVLAKIKSFLYKIDPVLQLGEAMTDFFGAAMDANSSGVPYVDVAIKLGFTVGAFLNLLRQKEEELDYSKEFVCEIFGYILSISETKNITRLKDALTYAQETLSKFKTSFASFISLPMAKEKVRLSLEKVTEKYLLAQERYNSYLRDKEWGWGWY